jgi:hypothetical protein
MTLGEVSRAIESYNRVKTTQQRERASFDYILADLIGRSVARIHHSSNKLPEISNAYPTLFDSKEIQEQKRQKQAEVSALRFRQFANSFNKRFSEVSDKNE